MITALVSFGAGFAIGVVLILVVAICLSAAHADRLADRVLGPGSSSPDFELGLLAVMDEDPTPHGRRHG